MKQNKDTEELNKMVIASRLQDVWVAVVYLIVILIVLCIGIVVVGQWQVRAILLVAVCALLAVAKGLYDSTRLEVDSDD